MSTPVPPKPAAPRLAAEIAKPLALSDAAKALLTPALTARQFFDALHAAGLSDDALRFLAVALPKRESVWWGWLCLREAIPTPPEPQAKALAAVERWVKDPSDGNRRAAGMAAEAAEYGNAPGSLALAAFWSGGSIAPPNAPAVTPKEEFTGLAVGGALLVASANDPETMDVARGRFLALGADVAAGKLRW